MKATAGYTVKKLGKKMPNFLPNQLRANSELLQLLGKILPIKVRHSDCQIINNNNNWVINSWVYFGNQQLGNFFFTHFLGYLIHYQ